MDAIDLLCFVFALVLISLCIFILGETYETIIEANILKQNNSTLFVDTEN